MGGTVDGLVSVVVPVRNGADSLGACLDALAAQEGAPPFEVIVVDNGSGDDTGGVALRHPLNPRLVREPTIGSYAARNAGVRVARGEMIAFTDADCTPAPGWLAAGTRALAGGDDVVGGGVRPVTRDDPTVWERWDAAVYLDQGNYVEQWGFAATANLFARREVFDRAGLFDPAFVSGGDVEWCRRATRSGSALSFAPEAVVRHRARRTMVSTWKLHRRLGAGWAALARRGLWPSIGEDPAVRLNLRFAAGKVRAAGFHMRRPAVVGVCLVVKAARMTGRLTGRP